MGKKDRKNGNLGKALIRDRFGPTKIKRNAGDEMLHSAEINDGYDWGRLNLQSVTEESSFQEFLSTAELAGTEFQAEKLNITFVNPKSRIGLLSKSEKEDILRNQEEHKTFLKIPRRPKWDSSTTSEELQTREKQEFLEWRRGLAILQETKDLILTPYEKNLEFWRQLWRVVERSDVVVQIVDARNPLLFRCEDLECYTKEVNSDKLTMILINKADFLTDSQRKEWAEYFTSINVQIAFFSATSAVEKKNEELLKVAENVDNEDEDIDSDESETEDSDDLSYVSNFCTESEYESATDEFDFNDSEKQKPLEQSQVVRDKNEMNDKLDQLMNSVENNQKDVTVTVKNSSELLTRDKLIDFFKTVYKGKTHTEGITTIGLVGYPNVGKSSTINALLMDKKVSVSATPGKTKHFQTLFLDKDLLLCDCPGLVMPSFICTKAEMILNGILPIDQMRDHVPAVTLLGSLIPKSVIEDLYGIMITPPLEGEDPDRPPTSEEILNAYGYNRGFMTQNGQPDNPRSARYILKDFVNGKLLYCVAPPTLKQEKYHIFPPRKRKITENKHIPVKMMLAGKGSTISTDDVDKAFFKQNTSGVHIRGLPQKVHALPENLRNVGSIGGSIQTLALEEKPWKKINKHSNKKKREKARRVYAYLDHH